MLIRYNGMPWSPCIIRKAAICTLCCRPTKTQCPAAVKQHYRPLTNGNSRMKRMCVTCAKRFKPIT